MKERSSKTPYRTLGNQLRKIREKKSESLAEVSGAVEIDVMLLAEIENGLKRPSEDILMLLMNHFSISDDEAVELWEMAGYSQDDTNPEVDNSNYVKQIMVLPMDARIVYTDMAHIVANNRGVILNFMQEAGLGGKPLAVSRVGMSREQATELLKLLEKALIPKMLPAPEKDHDSKSQKRS